MKSLTPIALIFLVFVLGCGHFKNNFRRSFTNFDPYKGSLSELLKPELSTALIKFKLNGTRDTSAQFKGATEAVGFTYAQDAMGTLIPVDGALVNYPSAPVAEAELAKIAASMNATLGKKSKGQKFAGNGGKFVGWTNGSLM